MHTLNIFQPHHFDFASDKMEACAYRANEIMAAYLLSLEKVYGDIRLGGYHGVPMLWTVDEKPDSTHSVRLIGVERLKTTEPR